MKQEVKEQIKATFEALRVAIETNYDTTRERALVMTKLEEAELWLLRAKER